MIESKFGCIFFFFLRMANHLANLHYLFKEGVSGRNVGGVELKVMVTESPSTEKVC